MTGGFWCLSLFLSCMVPFAPALGASLPRSVLFLEQSDVRGPFYAQIFAGFRSKVNSAAKAPISIYVENLDLSRFNGRDYEDSLQRHFRVKYRDKPIGVVVTVGASALAYAIRWRSGMWPEAPIVFAFVDETSVSSLMLPDNVTGRTVRLRLSDMVAAARAVVPDLKHVAIVGDRFEDQTAFAHFKDEMPAVAAELDTIDLTGLPMAELRERVAALPGRTAILYTAIYSDGRGTYFPPADALDMFAPAARAPIIASVETYVGRGAVGGFVAIPSLIGEEAAELAIEVVEGRDPSSIPITSGDALRPVFDWKQLRRWNVDEGRLPPGSDIRNRDLSVWQQYPREVAATAAVVILQTALIAALLHEHRRRRRAEAESRVRLSELAHMNRHATAGELSASIAHELNQPLGAILANAEAAEVLLASPTPPIEDLREILADIKRDNQRASEIIVALRRLLKKRSQSGAKHFDVNGVLMQVFRLVAVQASDSGIQIAESLSDEPLVVRGDPIQLQQVVLNLVMNAMDSIREAARGPRLITGRTTLVDRSTILISIIDSGIGIPPEKLAKVFEPFFTTKNQGMGMGLSIARTIIEIHGGSISASNGHGRGSVFRIQLPLARTIQEQGRWSPSST